MTICDKIKNKDTKKYVKQFFRFLKDKHMISAYCNDFNTHTIRSNRSFDFHEYFILSNHERFLSSAFPWDSTQYGFVKYASLNDQYNAFVHTIETKGIKGYHFGFRT